MFSLRACIFSDVQAASWGPGQHNLEGFELTTADILHCKNFSFWESVPYFEAEAEVWGPLGI